MTTAGEPPAGALTRIVEARHHDPFEVLGRHLFGDVAVVRVFQPEAARVELTGVGAMTAVGAGGLFEWRGPAAAVPQRYRLRCIAADGTEWLVVDPYAFPPLLSDYDLHLLAEGRHWHAYRILGAHVGTVDGFDGVRFAVWAPNAERVSVVGDFNRWDGRRHPMRVRGQSGVWELFVPGIGQGTLYKYEMRQHGGAVTLKSDPCGQRFEHPPRNANVVTGPSAWRWNDGDWLARRAATDWLAAPVAIYEVHAGSWRHWYDDRPLYRQLAEELVPYAAGLGFTHIELMPVTEHPFGGSWGYQTSGYFAATSRYGVADDLRALVDACHCRGLGVILDWPPAHFPKDAGGLARFDGTALYEHADPRRGEHREWDTLIFNYGRNEVAGFLLSSAVYWLEEFHFDGLRVDAVASMLYLDYSRAEGDWLANEYGGRENLEAVRFLREANRVLHDRFPGALMIAEESTSWPMVSRPVHLGGLGFTMKWNMGWMNDTLDYFRHDPVHRKYHHDRLTFSQIYAYSENFVLPLSHDEVVHGKRSLLDKMPGDAWQRFANLRLLFAWQYTHPGKKLNFMGNEFAQGREWSHERELDWALTDLPAHAGIQRLVGDLNRLYREQPPLHRRDCESSGFQWLDCHDADQSVLAFLRSDGERFLVVALNFTPVVRRGYRIGVPQAGRYRELFNSDSAYYGGSDVGNGGSVEAEPLMCMGQPFSLALTLPPLAALVLAPPR